MHNIFSQHGKKRTKGEWWKEEKNIIQLLILSNKSKIMTKICIDKMMLVNLNFAKKLQYFSAFSK